MKFVAGIDSVHKLGIAGWTDRPACNSMNPRWMLSLDDIRNPLDSSERNCNGINQSTNRR